MRRPQYLLPIFVLSTLTACGSDPSTSDETTFSSFSGTGDETASETGTSSSSSSESQGEASETGGDGDGDTSSEATTGDGDGDTSGDGDGDGDTSGDGDGDTSGDGDGDTSGDGDGDGDSTGDGDGDSTGDGDGDSTGDGDGDGDGATTGPTPCAEQPVNVSPVVPNVMLVLDKSNSMFANEWVPPGLPAESRWKTLHGVVSSTVNSFNTVVNFGSIMYPRTTTSSNWGADACDVSTGIDLVSVSSGMPAATAVIASLPDADLAADGSGARGATPTYAGLQAAYAELQPIYDADPTVPAFVILMTDGAANCDTTISGGPDTDALCVNGGTGLPTSSDNQIMQTYDPRLEPSVTAALGNGIPTFVVGIDMTENVATCDAGPALQFCGDPWKDTSSTCYYDADVAGGSEVEPWAKLDTLAENGGREQMGAASKFYNADDPAAFQDALADIISSVQSCVIPLDTPPPFPQTGVDVWIPDDSDPANKAPLVTNCLTEDGWVYTDGTFTAIELCGTFCDKLKTEQVADVDYFCTAG